MTDPIKTESKENEVRDLVAKIIEEGNLDKIKTMIKDNKIEFKINDKQYRIRLLSNREKEEKDYLIREKFGELLQNKNILTQATMKRIYKEREIIDIDELDTEIEKLKVEELKLRLQLGEVIAKNTSEKEQEIYYNKIVEKVFEQKVILGRKLSYFELSLENALANYEAKVITYLSTDVLEEDKWIRAFETLEDFENCNSDKLIAESSVYSNTLQYM